MSNWAFYNAVRAWVAQHPIPPADAAAADADDEQPPPPPPNHGRPIRRPRPER